jgi:hypothetical protein
LAEQSEVRLGGHRHQRPVTIDGSQYGVDHDLGGDVADLSVAHHQAPEGE